MIAWFFLIGSVLLAIITRWSGREWSRYNRSGCVFYVRLILGAVVYVFCAYVFATGLRLLVEGP